MGRAKEWMMEMEERGYGSPDIKYVCKDCFDDYAIQEFVNCNAEEVECDYCGTISKDEPIAAFLEDVIGYIMKGVIKEWGHPNQEGMSWCSREGGWQGSVIDDTWDLFCGIETISENDELMNDIIGTFNDHEWCKKNPYGETIDERLYYDWANFCRQVKYEVRYVFYRAPIEESSRLIEDNIPHTILDQLGNLVNELGLIKTLPAGNKFVRGRIHKPYEVLTTVKDLGPIQKEKSITPNRMSPTGIPAFYGSNDKTTAIKEIYNKEGLDHLVTTVTFQTMKNFKVLDLTVPLDIPSLFDENKWELRAPIIFIKSFIEDLSKEIKKDDREHIEYIPTQIVSEYFKLIFKDKTQEDSKNIKGILYPSARHEGGKSCVLFFQDTHCIQDDESKSESKSESEKWLKMISSTKETVNAKDEPGL